MQRHVGNHRRPKDRLQMSSKWNRWFHQTCDACCGGVATAQERGRAPCCCAPLAICSSAVIISADERLISSTALESSSAADATSSAPLPILVLFLSSSES